MRKQVSFLSALAVLVFCLALAQGGAAHAASAGRTAEKVGGYVSDSATTTEIKAKFLAQKGLDSLDLKVETAGGVVTLRGQVMTREQQELAVKIARETGGVRSVVDKISVMP